jgi:preprotein translocase subunit SecD
MLHNVFVFGFAGIAALCALGAWISRSKRTIFGLAALSAGSAAIAAYYYVFWALAFFGLCVPWIVFCALPWIDLGWRAKVGFVLFLALGSALVIFPTYHDERYGRIVDPGTSEERSEIETKAQRGELGFKRYLLSNIPFRLVRGLDLKGGLRLVYTVDVEEAIKDKRDYYYDQIRSQLATAFGYHTDEKTPATVAEMGKLTEKVKIDRPRDQVGEILLTFNDPKDSAKVDDAFLKKLIQELNVLRSSDGKKITFRMKSEVESQIRDRAVTQAKETVQRRVDGFGVKEVGIASRDEDIILEIPGENEAQFAEIRDIVSQTARLEFKMVDDDHDFFEQFVSSTDIPTGLRFERENAPLGVGKTKPVWYAFMPRAEHEDMRDTLARLKAWTDKLPVPTDNEISFEKVVRHDPDKDVWEDEGWRTFFLHAKAEVTGDMIREAQARPDQSDRSLGGWLVALEFTPVGAERFEDVTGKNIKRRFAIVLDGKVESAPVIQTKIGGGHGVITMGAGSLDEQATNAKKLELVLRSGALPAPISPSNEQRIGPSLGQDSIVQGLKAASAGTILVLVFMAVYYSRAGFIANIAVLFNLVLQVAILAMFGASMTLPGIAGLVLTIGIAVDANVLINERIREELRHGKSPRQAVDVGYDKAFSAILDGHVTTLISGLILAQYGTGPIKGFAVTLIVGIAASLFTGVVCTRLMFDWAVRGRRARKLYVG